MDDRRAQLSGEQFVGWQKRWPFLQYLIKTIDIKIK